MHALISSVEVLLSAHMPAWRHAGICASMSILTESRVIMDLVKIINGTTSYGLRCCGHLQLSRCLNPSVLPHQPMQQMLKSLSPAAEQP